MCMVETSFKKGCGEGSEGRGDLLLMETINIPSQWDNDVFLFAEM